MTQGEAAGPRMHYKPVRLTSCFFFPFIYLAVPTPVQRGLEVRVGPHCCPNTVPPPFEAFFSDEMSVMTNCLPNPIFHHLEFLARPFAY